MIADLPRGLGVFLTSGDVARMRKPEALGAEAERMLEASIRWVLVWCRSFDGRRVDPALAAAIADGLRGFGIGSSTWSFPAPAEAAVAGAELAAISKRIRAPLALFDIEDPDGKRGPLDWTDDEARAFLRWLVDGIDEHTMPGVTSYPGRAGHGLPWDELAWGVGVPQVYGTADSPTAARAAVERYRAVHGFVIPATSLRSPAKSTVNIPAPQLARRLDAIAIDPRTGIVSVRAIALWSWALLRSSAGHRKVAAAWAERHGW